MKKQIFRKKLSIRLQARFARRLAMLTDGGISLPEALSFMARSASKKRWLARAYIGIIETIKNGHTCSSAFEATGIFDASLIHMVRIGEKSGSLERVLLEAALMLERRDEISKKLIGVMIYPVFIAFATLGISLFLVLYIFPKIIPLVMSMNIPLPLLTRLLMAANKAMVEHWPSIILACMTSGIASFIIWKNFPTFREKVRGLIFHLPIIGDMVKAAVIIGIFKPLGILLDHGETLPTALDSVRDGTRYTEFKKILDDSIYQVTRGGKLSESLLQFSLGKPLFPGFVVDLIETGERTGGIALACVSIARIHEGELDEMIQRISGVIEPVLMLCMGGVVGSIALSIVMPIYEITNHLSH